MSAPVDDAEKDLDLLTSIQEQVCFKYPIERGSWIPGGSSLDTHTTCRRRPLLLLLLMRWPPFSQVNKLAFLFANTIATQLERADLASELQSTVESDDAGELPSVPELVDDLKAAHGHLLELIASLPDDETTEAEQLALLRELIQKENEVDATLSDTLQRANIALRSAQDLYLSLQVKKEERGD